MRGPDFTDTDQRGKTTQLTDIDKLAANVRNALLTDKGFRPNLPNYGSELFRLKFNLISDALLDLTTLFIRDCILTSVPEVQLQRIDYDVSKDNRSVKIKITFQDVSSGKLGDTSISFVNGEYVG